MRKNKGFTLVEILIVVVILGILAAIVIPQFSDASTQSKVSSAKSSLQSLRSQISLYKIQHTNDAPPTDETTFVAQMTGTTDGAGATTGTQFGPYLQAMPANPFNSSATVATADGAAVGWVYTPATGDIRVGGAGSTDINGDGDSTDAGEVHLTW